MSYKQEIYKEILFWALPAVRGTLSRFRRVRPLRMLFPGTQIALRSAYETAQLVHDLSVSILDEEFTDHDLWFLNHHARSFCERNSAKDCMPYSVLCYYIQELFKEVPVHKRHELMWPGPEGDYSWARPMRGSELGI